MIDLTEKLRDGVPQGIFDHGKTPARLIYWCRTIGSEIFGVPDLRDQLSDAALGLLPGDVRQRGTVERRKTVAQRAVLVNQCPASNFSGVRGQHQIDMQLLNRILNIGIFRFGLQHPKGFLKGGAG